MCGIAGIFRFDGRPVTRDVLLRMQSQLSHRGPDGNGIFIEGSAGLVHTRLAIVDPAGGAQPMVAETGRKALTYNGEVYNYRELRNRLGGQFWKTDTDTEVVLHAHCRWGDEAPSSLQGMFAYAVVDLDKQRLCLVRDRLGIKPLYYYACSEFLAFASEPRAILCALSHMPATAPDGLASFLRYGYSRTPSTIYQGLRRLPPAHRLVAEAHRGIIGTERYWSLRPQTRHIDAAAAEEELSELLTATIGQHLRADVPFGAFLSGGVDSSVVTALMSRQLPQPVSTFTIGFNAADLDEADDAAETARLLECDHHSQRLESCDAPTVQSILGHFGEPFADSSAIPTWSVSKLAATKVKMVLSGDGGDELFAGYDSYAHLYARRHRSVGDTIRSARCWAGNLAAHITGQRRGGRLFRPGWRAYHRGERIIMEEDVIRRLMGKAPADDFCWPDARHLDITAQCQLADIDSYLPDDILAKVDRMSMAHGLEVRVPLLDHRVVEFALALPPTLRLRRNSEGKILRKWLLRKVGERYLPAQTFQRPKRGFGIPLESWMQGPLKEMLWHATSAGGPLAGVLDVVEARRLVQDMLSEGRHVAACWSLLALAAWVEGQTR